MMMMIKTKRRAYTSAAEAGSIYPSPYPYPYPSQNGKRNEIYVCERPRRRPASWSLESQEGKEIFIKEKMPRQLNDWRFTSGVGVGLGRRVSIFMHYGY